MSGVLEYTPEAITAYRQAAKQRWEEISKRRSQRKKRAWELADLAAILLKTQFNATKVVVFGSLVRQDCFTLWSDVDIAAWGISSNDTFRAMGAVRD